MYVVFGAALALALLLQSSVRLNRFRAVLSQSLSRSLGRETTLQDVHLRLLPLPGFTFRRLRIADDDEFGGEPILQTQEDDGQYSVATLRLTSLWRGRLEIASVSLRQASLNLGHAPDGHWNLERLVNRAAEVPSAPTNKKKPEWRARFPYTELQDSRINFKFAAEKKPFALTDAEFALWLAAENRWNVRLKAVPMRTDGHISDTGVIRLSGSFDRANQFSQTPFHFVASWSRPEVDAITRIVRGHDPGWRGSTELNAEAKGTPEDFIAHVDVTVDEFRRYDIARNSSFDAHVTCDQHFRRTTAVPAERKITFNCTLPLGNGALAGDGEVRLGSDGSDFAVRIFASQVPAAALIQAALHAKRTLPSDLAADGLVNGDWSITRSGNNPVLWQGTLIASDVVLKAGVLNPGVAFPKSVVLNFATSENAVRGKPLGRFSDGEHVTGSRAIIEPFALDFGGPVQVSASFDAVGYRMNLQGPVEWQRVLGAAKALGLFPPPTDVQGTGVLQAQYAGQWQHFAPPTVSGEAQIQSASLWLRGFSEPLHVSGGTLKFNGSDFVAQGIQGSFARAELAFVGDFSGTRSCEKHWVCNLVFSLQVPELSEVKLATLLAPSSGLSLPFFAKKFEAKWLLDVASEGSVRAQEVVLHNLVARNVFAKLQVGSGKVLACPISAELFGGSHYGEWTFDLSGSTPIISAVGSIRHANMELLTSAPGGRSASGIVDSHYWLEASGNDVDQLSRSLNGGGVFSWRDGILQDEKDSQGGQLKFSTWNGEFTVSKQQLLVQNGELHSGLSTQQVSAQLSLTQPWKVIFTRPFEPPVLTTGTVAAPVAGTEPAALGEVRR